MYILDTNVISELRREKARKLGKVSTGETVVNPWQV